MKPGLSPLGLKREARAFNKQNGKMARRAEYRNYKTDFRKSAAPLRVQRLQQAGELPIWLVSVHWRAHPLRLDLSCTSSWQSEAWDALIGKQLPRGSKDSISHKPKVQNIQKAR